MVPCPVDALQILFENWLLNTAGNVLYSKKLLLFLLSVCLFVLGPWHSWGRWKDLRLHLKTRPPWFKTACFSLPDCFLACQTTQELPVTQLARHVDLFPLVIAENQRPETLSLPHGLTPSIKPIPNSPKSLLLDLRGDSPVVWISNKSFFSTCGVVFIWQYLTSGAKTLERLTGCFGLGLLPWRLCLALSRTQTAGLTPCASGLWILNLTA
jgi:hypothetical protein